MNRLIKAGALVCTLATLGACATTETLSSGTSTLDAVTPDITLNEFLETQMTALQKEAAVGHGENLDALAELVGSDDHSAFAQMMQVNYQQLFTGLQQPQQLLGRIEALRTAESI